METVDEERSGLDATSTSRDLTADAAWQTLALWRAKIRRDALTVQQLDAPTLELVEQSARRVDRLDIFQHLCSAARRLDNAYMSSCTSIADAANLFEAIDEATSCAIDTMAATSTLMNSLLVLLKPAANPPNGVWGKDKDTWVELDEEEQLAAKALGYGEESWDAGVSPEPCIKPWALLPPPLCLAARVLGYSSAEWDAELAEQMEVEPPVAAMTKSLKADDECDEGEVLEFDNERAIKEEDGGRRGRDGHYGLRKVKMVAVDPDGQWSGSDDDDDHDSTRCTQWRRWRGAALRRTMRTMRRIAQISLRRTGSLRAACGWRRVVAIADTSEQA